MTTTLLLTVTRQTPATDVLRILLDDVLRSVAADDETDRYSGRMPAGRALLSLAALARRAASALSAESGLTPDGLPGIVVQREVAAAARLLGEAAEATNHESWEIADLLVKAERLQAQLAASGGSSGTQSRGR
jgi:hypothetical protein